MFYKNSSIDFINLVNENNLKTPLLVYDEEDSFINSLVSLLVYRGRGISAFCFRIRNAL